VNLLCVIGRVWHPSGVRDVLSLVPGVSLRSTPGYCLATLRVGRRGGGSGQRGQRGRSGRSGNPGNPKGCQRVAGGRSYAKTSGMHSHKEMHPAGVPDHLPADP